MSNRELAMQLLSRIPEYKISYAIAYLMGLSADEDADDLYCRKLYEQYLAREEQDDAVSFEEACRICGVDFNAIRN